MCNEKSFIVFHKLRWYSYFLILKTAEKFGVFKQIFNMCSGVTDIVHKKHWSIKIKDTIWQIEEFSGESRDRSIWANLERRTLCICRSRSCTPCSRGLAL